MENATDLLQALTALVNALIVYKVIDGISPNRTAANTGGGTDRQPHPK